MQFSNICGTVYRQGNIIFTPDGNSLLSPVGNRVSVFDLVKQVALRTLFIVLIIRSNKSHTFPFENRKNIAAIALNSTATILISVDEGKLDPTPSYLVHSNRRTRPSRQFQKGRSNAPLQFSEASQRHQIFTRRKVSSQDALTIPNLHRFIAVTHGSHIQVWQTPNHLAREFAPFNLHRTYTGPHDDVLTIQWASDSK